MADAHRIQQTVKWVVYSLLIVNFGYYIYEDWTRATHTLTADSTFLDWTSEFATSIDESAWFLLLFMFELETYVLEDEEWKGWVAKTVEGIRILCYIMLAHSVYAFSISVSNMAPTVPVDGVNHLCEMTGQDVSYVYNLGYTEVNEATCDGLSDATAYYWVAEDPIVASMAGLELERELAWADLYEIIVWLIIVLSIELVVRLQARGVTGGAFIDWTKRIKLVLYATLIGVGIYWASLGHWIYLWDELVWIGGFAAIEMNVSEWRDEILARHGAMPNEGATA